MWPGFDKFGGHFLCFSTITDQESRNGLDLCVTGEKPGLHTGQVTGSVRRSQHQGQTAQHRTELCPTAPSVMLGHTAITLLLHNTGAECNPPPSPLSPHTQKYTHAMPPFRTHHPAITGSGLVGLRNQSELWGSRSAPRLHLSLRNKS